MTSWHSPDELIYCQIMLYLVTSVIVKWYYRVQVFTGVVRAKLDEAEDHERSRVESKILTFLHVFHSEILH